MVDGAAVSACGLQYMVGVVGALLWAAACVQDWGLQLVHSPEAAIFH